MVSSDSMQLYTNLARYDTVSILAFLKADYASLREDALQQNLFTASNNQIFDVAGRTQSPYIQKHVFAAAPVLPVSPFKNEIRLGYQPLFYSNGSAPQVLSVQVDLLDGTGYHPLYASGTALQVSKTYTDSSGYKKFAVKVTYTSGTTDVCYTAQYVNVEAQAMLMRYSTLTPTEISTPAHIITPTAYLNVNPMIPNIPFLPHYQQLLATQHFNQDMKMYIRYSTKRNGTALQNKIVKPFIVVEGYDITDASKLLKPNNYGLNDLLREWQDIIKPPTNFDFNAKLDEEAGYDLIFIDYYTMRSVTENADYLLQAIDWINSQKVNNAVGVREQNEVMGISMGGLVTRYALAKRTKQTGTNSTETRQLITMDSPHQGANVPIGFQHFLYDFGETKIVKPIKSISAELQDFYNLNEQPATQQQLIIRVTDGNGTRANNSFLAAGGPYRTMIDYTAPYQFLAVSNGSQCAVPVMDPGTLLLQRSGNIATANWIGGLLFKNKYKLAVQVNALPTYGTQTQVCSVVMQRNIRLFLGAIGTGWHTTSNSTPRISPANTIPWDGVPGGTRDAEADGAISQSGTFPPLRKSNTFFGNIWRSLVGAAILNIDYNINFPFSQRYFSFVPITSSLDVQNVTNASFSQPFNFAVNGLNGSRALKFIAQKKLDNGLYNAFHTDFYPRNAQWIYNEMEAITQPPLGCDDYCGSPSINGPVQLCSFGRYSISNLPNGSSVVWSASPASFVTINAPNSTSTTISASGSGTVIITATITNSCGITSVPKSITVGPLPLSSYSIAGATTVYASAGYHYAITFPLGAFPNNIFWQVPTGWTILDGQGTTNVHIWTGSAGGQVQCDFDNSCGEATGIFITAVIGSGGPDPELVGPETSKMSGTSLLTATPNPASSRVIVSLTQSQSSVASVKNINAIKQIKIIDKMGVVKKQFNFNNNNTSQSINVSGMQPDTYFIQAYNGSEWLSCKLIIIN